MEAGCTGEKKVIPVLLDYTKLTGGLADLNGIDLRALVGPHGKAYEMAKLILKVTLALFVSWLVSRLLGAFGWAIAPIFVAGTVKPVQANGVGILFLRLSATNAGGSPKQQFA